MDIGRLFPKSVIRNEDEKIDNLFYLVMVDWGWSYEQFIATPIPVMNRLLRVQAKRNKEANKKRK